MASTPTTRPNSSSRMMGMSFWRSRHDSRFEVPAFDGCALLGRCRNWPACCLLHAVGGLTLGLLQLGLQGQQADIGELFHRMTEADALITGHQASTNCFVDERLDGTAPAASTTLSSSSKDPESYHTIDHFINMSTSANTTCGGLPTSSIWQGTSCSRRCQQSMICSSLNVLAVNTCWRFYGIAGQGLTVVPTITADDVDQHRAGARPRSSIRPGPGRGAGVPRRRESPQYCRQWPGRAPGAQ